VRVLDWPGGPLVGSSVAVCGCWGTGQLGFVRRDVRSSPRGRSTPAARRDWLDRPAKPSWAAAARVRLHRPRHALAPRESHGSAGVNSESQNTADAYLLPTIFRCVARHTLASGVPKSVPKRGPTAIIRQPTPTMKPIKNGPEIINFRPVLRFLAALANRRLQPLGHLTANAKCN
jgi:hypothetical protein